MVLFVTGTPTSFVLGLATLNELLFVRYKNRTLLLPHSQYDILIREIPPDVMMLSRQASLSKSNKNVKILNKLSVFIANSLHARYLLQRGHKRKPYNRQL